jgi:hypothetical protein
MTIVAPIMQSITLPKLLPAVEWVGNSCAESMGLYGYGGRKKLLLLSV